MSRSGISRRRFASSSSQSPAHRLFSTAMRYRVVFTLIASTFLIGCANPWEKGFDPNPELRGRSFPAAQQVDLRTVEFERLQNYEKAERKLRVESKVNPADFTTT